MRLYKTELFKLCHRKIFIAGTIFAFPLQFLIHKQEIRTLKSNLNDMGYQTGWSRFPDMYNIAMMVLSIVLVCIVSTVFSHEEQTKMKPLLLTTQEGPAKDTYAKIAAAYTVSIGLWLITTIVSLFLFGTAFESKGLDLPANLALWDGLPDNYNMLIQPFGMYLVESLLVSLLGILELCAVTLAVSARSRNTFHSLCASALCWIMPVFAFYIMRASTQLLMSSGISKPTVILVWSVIFFFVYCLIYSAPFYLVWPNILVEISGMSHSKTGTILFVMALGCIVMVLCAINAYHRYRSAYHD